MSPRPGAVASELPLRRGDRGEAVRDVQRRLGELGLGCDPDELAVFGDGTEAALRTFQERRGLRVDGICGRQTWGSLIEAGWRLGDRLLYYTSPMLRGDDIAALQRRLGALGFDAGRVDGIFGEDTQRALLEFQRNAGVPADVVCGPDTVGALNRLSGRTDDEPVAGVRERVHLRNSPPTLDGRRVVVGELGGLAALAGAVTRAVNATGASVVSIHQPDPSEQAAQANALGADAYLGLTGATTGCRTAYYAGHGFESPGGRCLADQIQAHVAPILGAEPSAPVGMAIPVLRETRMPAVVCELGPMALVVERGPAVADRLAAALAAWVEGLADV